MHFVFCLRANKVKGQDFILDLSNKKGPDGFIFHLTSIFSILVVLLPCLHFVGSQFNQNSGFSCYMLCFCSYFYLSSFRPAPCFPCFCFLLPVR